MCAAIFQSCRGEPGGDFVFLLLVLKAADSLTASQLLSETSTILDAIAKWKRDAGGKINLKLSDDLLTVSWQTTSYR